MKTHQINGIDEIYFTEKLANGLQIIMYPNAKVKGYHITFTTKFGNIHNEFKHKEEDNFHQVPFGTAHFLEHQLFEGENGTSLSKRLKKYGASSNAYTNQFRTEYEVKNNVEFAECLKILIHYIQNPSFNEETVEKERGIILEELKSYLNDPGTALYYLRQNQFFVNGKEKYYVTGNEEDISSITVNDLRLCHEYFYHPGNMILTITGDFNKEEAVKIIKKEQKNANYSKYKKVILKKNKEPMKLNKLYDEKNMNISIPVTAICYKFDRKKINKLKLSDIELQHYVKAILSCNFGCVSELIEYAEEKNLVTNGISYGFNNTNKDVLGITFSFVSNKSDELIKLIQKQMHQLNTDNVDYQRKRKSCVSDYVLMFDSIYSVNTSFTSDLIYYGRIIDDYYDIIQKYDFATLLMIQKEIISNCDKFTIGKILPYKN